MTLLEDLLDLELPESIRISPDKQKIVYYTSLINGHKKGDHATSTIWLAETGKPRSARQLTNGFHNDREPKWSPTGGCIGFLSDRGKRGESSAVYLMPLNGGEPFPVTPADNQSPIEHFEFSPDGKIIAIISADEKSEAKKAKEKDKDDAQVWGQDWAFNRLRLVDVATRTVTTLVNMDSHVTGLAWDDSGDEIAFTAAQTPDIESSYLSGSTISTVNVADKTKVQLCTFPHEAGDLIWSGRRIYFIASVEEKFAVSASAVYMIDLGLEPTTYHQHAHGVQDCAISLAKTDNSVVVEVQHRMEDQLRILGGTTLLSKTEQLMAWHAACTTEGGEVVIAVAVSSTSKPCEVYSTTGAGGELVQLSEHGKFFADRKFSSCKFISCPSADERVSLDAVWLAPAGSEARSGPIPTIVLIHGGPYSRYNNAFDTSYFMWAPLLLSAGFAILVPNYRGSSSQGEKFAAYARGGGKYDYEDIITLTQHAIEEGYADKDRLIAAGWSHGGFLSYLSSVRNGLHGHGWKFQATIPGAGVSDPDPLILTSDIGVVEAELVGKLPWQCDKNDTSNRQGSAIWEFHSATKKGGVIPPMLILHGEKDSRVPIEQAHGMRRALQSAGLPFEFATYPRQGHMIAERKHLVDMGERVLKFVEKHIGRSDK